ncbi:hypothetical protein MRX96_002805 [Rhipicephalus microplus]
MRQYRSGNWRVPTHLIVGGGIHWQSARCWRGATDIHTGRLTHGLKSRAVCCGEPGEACRLLLRVRLGTAASKSAHHNAPGAAAAAAAVSASKTARAAHGVFAWCFSPPAPEAVWGGRSKMAPPFPTARSSAGPKADAGSARANGAIDARSCGHQRTHVVGAEIAGGGRGEITIRDHRCLVHYTTAKRRSDKRGRCEANEFIGTSTLEEIRKGVSVSLKKLCYLVSCFPVLATPPA